MQKLAKLFFFVIAFFQSFSLAQAQVQKLTQLVTPESYPPYIMNAENGKPARGIMIEILQAILKEMKIELVILEVPRKRIDELLKENEADLVAFAKEWAKDADQFEFTEPVIRVRDVVFSLKDKPLHYQQPADLFGKIIGHPNGYQYPPVEQYFKEGKINRIEIPDEEKELQMLLLGRIDGAFIAENVGSWLIKKNDYKDKFIHSQNEVSGFDYRYMLIKKRAELVPIINQQIKNLKAQGVIDKIIKQY